MFRPSGIKLPAGSTYKAEEVSKGVYVVTNAYEGRYEYFDDRPIAEESASEEQKSALPDGQVEPVAPEAHHE